MPKKSRTSKNRSKRTRKQKVINIIGCSKKHKHNKSCKKKDLGNNGCPNCGPNCHCGPNCNCPHPCPGSCYLNRRKKLQKGGFGSGCGSCGCPIGGLSYTAMNKFGGGYTYPDVLNKPVLIDGSDSGEFIKIPGTAQNGGSYGKMYGKMYGGTCGGTCSIKQSGGNCNGTCSIPPQSGGNFFKPAAPIPGPFTGSSWGGSVKEWPGMNGIGGDRNYLNSYSGVIGNDPQLKMSMEDSGYKSANSMVGGYVYKNKKHSPSKLESKSMNKSKSQRGGGLVPQDLVNLGRNFTFNLKSAYNSLNGYSQPVDPLPYKDQLTRSFNNNKFLF